MIREALSLLVGISQALAGGGEPGARLASPSDYNHFGGTHYGHDFEFTWPEQRVSLEEATAVLEKLPLKETYQRVVKTLAAAMRRKPLTMSETERLTATTPAPNVLRVRYDVAL